MVQKLKAPACLICNINYVCVTLKDRKRSLCGKKKTTMRCGIITPCFVPEVLMKFYCVTFSGKYKRATVVLLERELLNEL